MSPGVGVGYQYRVGYEPTRAYIWGHLPHATRGYPAAESPHHHPLAPMTCCAIRFLAVMSASVKPRLAGRQPSNRGGVPRVIDQVE